MKRKKSVDLTIIQAAEMSGLSPQTLRNYCRAGVFKSAKKVRGTRWVLSSRDIEDLVTGDLDASGTYNLSNYADWT